MHQLKGALLLLLPIAMSACALRMSPSSFDISTGKQIPIKAQYYVAHELCDIKESLGIITIYTGEGLCTGIDKVMHSTFVDAVKVPSEDVDISPDEVRVSPRLLAIDMWMPLFAPPTEKNREWHVRMQWTITDWKKRTLWSDTIDGSDARFCLANSCLRDRMEGALQDQLKKVVASMLRYEWWKSVRHNAE